MATVIKPIRISIFLWILGLIVLNEPDPADALFFHLKPYDKKCFIQEIPDDTIVAGKYKVELMTWSGETGSFVSSLNNISATVYGLTIEVKNPSGSIVLSKMYGLEGRFTFTSYTSGEHTICLAPNGTVPNRRSDSLRMHLNIEIGGMALDYDIIRKKEKLTEIQLRIRKLIDLTEQIRRDQNYQRQREARFRVTSDTTNRLVMIFAVVQTLEVICIGVYLVRNLKEFFYRKKLV